MATSDSITAAAQPDGSLAVSFPSDRFPKDAVYGAAFTLIDRFFVLLDERDGTITANLRPKAATVSTEGLAAALENELVGLAWRRSLVEQSKALTDRIVQRAFGAASGPAGLDDLLGDAGAGGDAAAFDDPLGIAMSWEEKHLKKP